MEEENKTVFSNEETNKAQPAEISETGPAGQNTGKKQKKPSRRKRWKAHKKAKRAALKEDYKDAPFLKRIFRLYLWKPLLWIVLLMLLFTRGVPAILGSESFGKILRDTIFEFSKKPVEQEKILERSPLDEAGAERISALEGYSPEDTWAIYVYMVGSNLEDMNENDLSGLTQYITAPQKEKNIAEHQETVHGYVDKFMADIEKEGMTLPEYLFLAEKPVASSKVMTQDVIVADMDGCASEDIAEMKKAELPENVNIVIQTGGARRWSNPMVNPNKTQRFLINQGYMSEVDNMPLQDSCDPDTISDFLRFCKKNYPADHKILLFWDHGGASFGFGSDEIFGTGTVSLSQLRSAISKVYRPDENNPAFEIIGFDACLMAGVETAHALDGLGRYLVASEEVEPGSGWDHTTWMTEFGKDTSVSPAAICRYIVDSYMDFYMRWNINVGALAGETACQFSVIDIAEAENLYDEYCNFASSALKAAVEDPSNLALLGRAASRSTRYAGESYRVYNTIDLGNFADALIDDFPEESAALKEALQKAVLYNRSSGYLVDSQGLNVYMPVQVEGLGGIINYLEYINSISDNTDISALYYYKLAGCLNDEYKEYVSSKGYGEAKNLDISAIKKVGESEVQINGMDYSIAVSDETAAMIQNCRMYLVWSDDRGEKLIYLGEDNYAVLDGEGNITTEYEGEWITFGGQPLAVEIIDETASSVKYRSKVTCNGKDSYLVFAYNKDTDDFTISGIWEIPAADDSGVADVANRIMKTLTTGDKIVPVHKVTYPLDGTSCEETGKPVVFKPGTTITCEALKDGKYLSFFVLSDPRGDEYYSQMVAFKVTGGKITTMEPNDDYAVITTE